jgi:Mrp family chromosome partitioning ATPase
MSECTHNCSTCGSDCASRKEPQSLIEKPNQLSKINKVIGIVSGKGGVGKTMVSSMLAVGMQRLGKNVGLLDADIVFEHSTILYLQSPPVLQGHCMPLRPR